MADIRITEPPVVSAADFHTLASFSLAVVDDCEHLPPIHHPPAYMGELLRTAAAKAKSRGKIFRIFDDTLELDSSYIGCFRNAQVADRRCVVRTQEGPFVAESLQRDNPDEGVQKFLKGELVSSQAAEAGFVIGGWMISNYYHWMMQALPTLGFLDRLPFPDCRIVMQKPTKWQKRSLQLVGIDLTRIDVINEGEARRYENLYFPYSVIGHYHGFRPGLREFYGQMSARAKLSGGGDILLYVSRRKTTLRPLYNEAELEAALVQRGFTVIVPEELSLDDQIDAFRRARLIVAPHGSALTNMAFCRPGTTLYELLPWHHVRSGSLRVAQYYDFQYMGDCFKTSAEDPIGGWVIKLPRVLDKVDSILKEVGRTDLVS